MDFIQALRMMNVFGMQPPSTGMPNQQPPPDNTPPPNTGGDNLQNIGQIMSKLYTPETTASDKFNSMIDSYPQAGHGQGALRKIGAVLGGTFGGPGVYNDIMNPGLSGKMAEWNAKIKPAEQAATLEKQSNTNSRMAAFQAASEQLKEEDLVRKQKNDDTRNQLSEERNKINELAKNGFKFDHTGPTIIATKPDGTIQDTGVPSGHLSALDKLDLEQKNKLAQIEKTGEIQSARDQQKQTWTGQNIIARGNVQKDVKAASGPIKPESATQDKVGQFNRARELYNSNPTLRPFIHLGPNANDFTIDPPSKGGLVSRGGPTQQQYDEINKHISSGGGNNQQTRQVRNIKTGEVKTQVSDDGGKTWNFKD